MNKTLVNLCLGALLLTIGFSFLTRAKLRDGPIHSITV